MLIALSVKKLHYINGDSDRKRCDLKAQLNQSLWERSPVWWTAHRTTASRTACCGFVIPVNKSLGAAGLTDYDIGLLWTRKHHWILEEAVMDPLIKIGSTEVMVWILTVKHGHASEGMGYLRGNRPSYVLFPQAWAWWVKSSSTTRITWGQKNKTVNLKTRIGFQTRLWVSLEWTEQKNESKSTTKYKVSYWNFCRRQRKNFLKNTWSPARCQSLDLPKIKTGSI